MASFSLLFSFLVYAVLIFPKSQFTFDATGLSNCEPYYYKDKRIIIVAFSLFFVPSILCVIYCYSAIFFVAHRQLRQIRRDSLPRAVYGHFIKFENHQMVVQRHPTSESPSSIVMLYKLLIILYFTLPISIDQREEEALLQFNHLIVHLHRLLSDHFTLDYCWIHQLRVEHSTGRSSALYRHLDCYFQFFFESPSLWIFQQALSNELSTFLVQTISGDPLREQLRLLSPAI